MKKISLYLSLFALFFVGVISLSLSSKPHSTASGKYKRKICLNMIVKNESSIIEKCLASTKGLIDYWVIVDTGSTDGTQQVIKTSMKGIPGELHERPWVNFEHNRNEALALAKDKAEYTLFMDADEVLLFSKDFMKPDMTQDIYSIQLKQEGASDSVKWFMIKNSLDWRWQGVLHETIVCPEAKTQQMIPGVVNYSNTSLGARSRDPQKYLKDAAVLEAELQKDPSNSRYRFYLASSYLNANELYLAMENYKLRAKMAGERGEVFISLLMTARLQEFCSVPSALVVQSYLKAHEHTPSRAEPLFYLGVHYLEHNQPDLAYEVLQKTPSVFHPSDTFFTQTDIYDWRLSHTIARAALSLKKYPEMRQALQKTLRGSQVPADVVEEAKKNLSILQTMLP